MAEEKKTEKQAEDRIPEKVVFEYNGSTYTLEFDRASVVKAERVYDISLAELSSGKLSYMDALFAAAFIKHHPNIKPGVVQGLYERMPDKAELYRVLVGMYAGVANATLEDPDEGERLTWRAV